jgi:hypothetical protein
MKILSLTLNEFSDGLEHIVEYVHWEVDGIKGNTKLDPPKSIFKPLATLTDAEVIAWVYAKDAKKIEKFKRNKRLSKAVPFGEVPALSDEAEEAKKDYWVEWATQRLAQHILLEGREEVVEDQPTGEQVFNEEAGVMEDVLAPVVVQTAIDPVPEYVEVTVYDDEGNASTETVRNPLVEADEAERAKAQEILEMYA